MKIQNLYEPYELELIKTESYISNPHKKTFFELVFVLEGKGTQIVNQNHLPYSANKLFLLFPEDTHGFDVEETSQFFFIRFNDSYLRVQSLEWIQRMEFIFNVHNHLPGCILKNVADKPLIRALVEALIRESIQKLPNSETVKGQLINTIITISARNIFLQERATLTTSTSDISVLLVNYVQEHIYEPEALKVESIASFFNVALTYFSEFFQKHIGLSLQQYIINYKIKLLETRLIYTDMRISEIADEFGFTDESHLYRIFKKYKEVGPSEFRKLRRSSL